MTVTPCRVTPSNRWSDSESVGQIAGLEMVFSTAPVRASTQAMAPGRTVGTSHRSWPVGTGKMLVPMFAGLIRVPGMSRGPWKNRTRLVPLARQVENHTPPDARARVPSTSPVRCALLWPVAALRDSTLTWS